jgi:hypothetical protein
MKSASLRSERLNERYKDISKVMVRPRSGREVNLWQVPRTVELGTV